MTKDPVRYMYSSHERELHWWLCFISHAGYCLLTLQHGNGNVILTKFSSLAALEVIIFSEQLTVMTGSSTWSHFCLSVEPTNKKTVYKVCWYVASWYRRLSDKLWHLQHRCVGDSTDYDEDSDMYYCHDGTLNTVRPGDAYIYAYLTIIGSPGRCQAIIWANSGILLIGP